MRPVTTVAVVLLTLVGGVVACGSSDGGRASSQEGGAADDATGPDTSLGTSSEGSVAGDSSADASSSNPSGCPATVPATGSACPGLGNITCVYDVTDCQPCGTQMQCSSGTWKSLQPPCRAPIPPCPLTAPKAGDRCPAWTCQATWECGYPACTRPLDRMATCSGGTWQVAAPSQCDASAD
jgi:hypothetical protein